MRSSCLFIICMFVSSFICLQVQKWLFIFVYLSFLCLSLCLSTCGDEITCKGMVWILNQSCKFELLGKFDR